MSDEELPEVPGRRALIIWYDDETNTIEMYADEFGALEVPELLKVALDIAEGELPVPVYDDTEEE